MSLTYCEEGRCFLGGDAQRSLGASLNGIVLMMYSCMSEVRETPRSKWLRFGPVQRETLYPHDLAVPVHARLPAHLMLKSRGRNTVRYYLSAITYGCSTARQANAASSVRTVRLPWSGIQLM